MRKNFVTQVIRFISTKADQFCDRFPFPAKASSPSMLKRLILICFFISGACGLVYEVTWLRTMGLIFGNTTIATSMVLAGYMAGLGFGALWWGKKIEKGGCPIRTYANLEAGIGLYALLTPLIWALIDLLTIAFYRFFSPSFPVAFLFKLSLSFITLFFPTFLMGATLPVLSKYFVTQKKDVAKQVGLLYGLNTFGAVAGVLFSSFVALQHFGVWQTVYLTGLLNFAIFYFCRRYGKTHASVPNSDMSGNKINSRSKVTGDSTVSSPGAFSPAMLRTLYIIFAISGGVSMMYEIAWTRTLAMSLGSSVYAFSIMLATFLFGMSSGSYAFSIFARWIRPDLRVFSALQLMTALLALWGINIFNDMPYYFARVFAASHGSELLLNAGRFALCSLVMFPPTFMIGAIFTCFIQILSRSRPLGTEIGEAYFSNTVGTIVGSILTGFLFIPLLGIQRTLFLAVGLNSMIGILAFFLSRERLGWKRGTVLALIVALLLYAPSEVRPWDRGFIASELAVRPASAMGLTKNQILNSMKEQDLLFYKEGSSATVTVKKLRDNLSMAVNGKVDASNQDTFTQFLLGHLPMALHPRAEDVCVIGLGSGSTAAAVASYPVRKIDMVELEKEVVVAANFFSQLNRNVLQDPRLRVHINDGRNFLLLHPQKYDVLISEPSNPWMSGVANLFSLEHYQTMKKRLKPGGVICQWMHAYSMSPDDLKMIVRTFAEVFPEISLWVSYFPDLMLIGTAEPLALDMKNLEKAYAIPKVRNDLIAHGIKDPAGLLSAAWLFDPSLRRLARGAKINSDNHPYLEFSAPRSLYKDTVEDNFRLLSPFYRLDSFPLIRNLEPPQDKNPAFYNSLARGYLVKSFYANAENALSVSEKIDPAHPETRLLRGIFYYLLGMKERAREILIQVVITSPDWAEAYEYLGLISQDSGKFTEAVNSFRKACELEPENIDHQIRLANALLKAGETKEAIEAFDNILTRRPEDFENRVKRAELIVKTGSPEQGLSAAHDVIKKYPRFMGAYEWVGSILEKNGQLDQALAVYDNMLSLFPNDPTPHINLARLSESLGRPQDMKWHLEKAAALNPALTKVPSVRKLLASDPR
ncbi:MAG TPA: fused MFS/spermidine synthase [Candidatus Omnitrophota bacterium]|nr:fused MFS/spermidine synthase [Candidatus Omnitrophota bacterium]